MSVAGSGPWPLCRIEPGGQLTPWGPRCATQRGRAPWGEVSGGLPELGPGLNTREHTRWGLQPLQPLLLTGRQAGRTLRAPPPAREALQRAPRRAPSRTPRRPSPRRPDLRTCPSCFGPQRNPTAAAGTLDRGEAAAQGRSPAQTSSHSLPAAGDDGCHGVPSARHNRQPHRAPAPELTASPRRGLPGRARLMRKLRPKPRRREKEAPTRPAAPLTTAPSGRSGDAHALWATLAPPRWLRLALPRPRQRCIAGQRARLCGSRSPALPPRACSPPRPGRRVLRPQAGEPCSHSSRPAPETAAARGRTPLCHAVPRSATLAPRWRAAAGTRGGGWGGITDSARRGGATPFRHIPGR